MTTERMSGPGANAEGADTVTDGRGAEPPTTSVRVMPLWARPLAEPEEPGWSMAGQAGAGWNAAPRDPASGRSGCGTAARQALTGRSRKGVGV